MDRTGAFRGLVGAVAPIRTRLHHLMGEGRGEVGRALREGAEAARACVGTLESLGRLAGAA